MGLPGWIAVGAFIILGIMFALLWASGRRDERDAVTQEIIIRANTAPVTVVAPVTAEPAPDPLQEETH